MKLTTKGKKPSLLPRNREISERDGMPVQVATDLLCQSIRTTARQRKTYQAARQTVFQSTLQPKPIEDKVAKRMAASNWEQLHKWLKRVIVKRMEHQREYLRIPDRKLAKPIADLLLRALEKRVEHLDLLRDTIENEIKTRQDMCQSNAKTPTLAQTPYATR